MPLTYIPKPSVRAQSDPPAHRGVAHGLTCQLTIPPSDLVPTEPAYLTNRAAAFIALKRFRSALADCQLAATLQASASPDNAAPPKTLLRLARCQLALAQTAAALSTLRAVLAAEPTSAPAAQMQARALELEAHTRNLIASRQRREWGMARIALERCLHAIEAEGSEIPTEWRQWRVELELARGNWDAANSAAKCVPLPPSSRALSHCLGCPPLPLAHL